MMAPIADVLRRRWEVEKIVNPSGDWFWEENGVMIPRSYEGSCNSCIVVPFIHIDDGI